MLNAKRLYITNLICDKILICYIKNCIEIIPQKALKRKPVR